MSTFTAPNNVAEVPPTAVGADPLMNRVCNLYQFTLDRGRNVYYLSDGTVTETDPDGTTVKWANDGQGTTYVTQTWWGGHEAETVTTAQATALSNAGYTVV